MESIKVYSMEGEIVDEIIPKEEVFGLNLDLGLLHFVVRAHLASRRAGTACTKTRGEVRGGGRKPWRQKGTGRARHGSIRSPIWRGGGVVFGPKPRDYSFKVNKKVRRKALKIALSLKYKSNNIIIFDKLNLDEPKTRKLLEVFSKLNLNSSKLLLVINKDNKNVYLASRNLPYVEINNPESLGCYEVLNADKLVFDLDTFSKVQERLAKK